LRKARQVVTILHCAFRAIIFSNLALAPIVLDLLGLHCKAGTWELIESIKSIIV
jgi:hypothetical protein